MRREPGPGLVTGTSSEYLGSRPARKIFRQRLTVVVMGPSGVGKTTVAMKLAQLDGAKPCRLDTVAVANEVVHRARSGRWSTRVLEQPALVLDGPTYLRDRPGVVELLCDVVRSRMNAGLRTIICEQNNDGSTHAVLQGMPVGSVAVLGLRFPRSRAGRMRFARRTCSKMGIDPRLARGTDAIEPWAYDEVAALLRALATERSTQGDTVTLTT